MSTLDPVEDPPRRSWLTGKRLVGIAIAVLIVLRIAIDLIPIRVHISPETTVIDSPLREDGTPDYAAYLNEQWADGVTPEENAVVDLLRAFGPGIINEGTREAYFEQLGIPIPPVEGDYYVDFLEFMTQNRPGWNMTPIDYNPLIEMQRHARTRPWSPEKFPEIAKWIQAKEQHLEAMLTATSKPRYFSPMIPPNDRGLIEAVLPTIQESSTAARLIVTNAMFVIQQGNIDRALELTLACHRLSRLISEHPTTIGQFVAHKVSAMAARCDEQIILSGRLSAEQAVAYRQQLDSLPPFQPMAEVIDQGERFLALDALIAMSAGRVGDDLVEHPQLLQWAFDPNPMLFQFNNAFDETTAAFKLPDRLERTRVLNAIDNRRSRFTRPSAGRLLVSFVTGTRRALSDATSGQLLAFLTPATKNGALSEDRGEVHNQLIDLGYALAIHRAEIGSFPETLDTLVPKDLDAIPIDPFSGNEIRYQLTETGFLLWSIGHDQIDDGGSNEHGADDIAFGDRPPKDE